MDYPQFMWYGWLATYELWLYLQLYHHSDSNGVGYNPVTIELTILSPLNPHYGDIFPYSSNFCWMSISDFGSGQRFFPWKPERNHCAQYWLPKCHCYQILYSITSIISKHENAPGQLTKQFPSGYLTVRYGKWPIEIDGLPIKNGWIFHGKLLVSMW